jgi:uncharacterized membrane-anchored protein YitT (DUF2179 family)
MTRHLQLTNHYLKIIAGTALFGLGFNLFLQPSGLNAGGISGLAMILVNLTGFGSVGTITALVNIPLFVIAWSKLGKRFLLMSVVGLFFCSIAIDLLSRLPKPSAEPIVCALYGGSLCGLGLGTVFSVGASTGGSDIIVRLIKKRRPDMPIGVISVFFDLSVAVLTGIVFGEFSRTLYSGVAIFVAGQVIDAVVYRFDYSRVALIISKHYDAIACSIANELFRGVTFLYGEGSFHHQNTKVILTAVKRQQLSELKDLVADIDPDAFIIVQEAHQVLGDGFSRYSKDAL